MRSLLFAILASVLLAFVAIVSVSSTTEAPSVEAGPPSSLQIVWGDVGCNDTEPGVREITREDFLLILAYVARSSINIAVGDGCPVIGEPVNVMGYGSSILWGDNDCDGSITPLDGLLVLYFLAEINPIAACSLVAGIAYTLLANTADIKAVSMSHTVPALLGSPPGQASTQHFQNLSVITAFGEVKHNNGPNATDVLVSWFVDLEDDEAYFNWVALSDDDACYYLGLQVPCMEGSPEDGDTYDNCEDDEDNDGDDLVDGEDPDCVDYIDEIRFVVHLPPSVQTVIARSIIVECKVPGPFGYVVEADQVPLGAFDPNLDNNYIEDSVPTGSDPQNCVPTKSQLGVGDSQPATGERPVPYQPVALPNTGGRP